MERLEYLYMNIDWLNECIIFYFVFKSDNIDWRLFIYMSNEYKDELDIQMNINTKTYNSTVTYLQKKPK